jgi:cytidyltransferase-like protein
MGSSRRFGFACTGGTFGPFHEGHEHLFYEAFQLSEHLFIRLTSDKYLAKYARKVAQHVIPSQLERFYALQKHLHEFYRGRFEILMLDEREECENCDFRDLTKAIICGQDSVGKAYALNLKRRESGLYEVKIIGVPVKRSRDQQRISSSRIRCHEIDARGELLI